MKHEVIGGSAFPLLKVELDAGESVKAQSGAMVAMTAGLKLEGKVDGGVGRAIGRLFSGESFFMQHVTAESRGGWVLFASPVPGGITAVDIKAGQELSVQKNGFLVGTAGVHVSTKVQSLTRGMFGGEGLFVVKVSGEGVAFLNAYGAIHALDIPAGGQLVVDNGHLVAWDSDMKYEITKAANSWFGALTSGSGFVCKFTGPGRVHIQTRNPWGLGGWLAPYMPTQQTSSRG